MGPIPDARSCSSQGFNKHLCNAPPTLTRKQILSKEQVSALIHKNQALQELPVLGRWDGRGEQSSVPAPSRESRPGGWRASSKLTLQMVATQMLPRFSGSIASSFIPSSNQPPSVYTARTFKEWHSWGIRAGPAEGWRSQPLGGKRGGKGTSLERAGVLRLGLHPQPRVVPHLLEQVRNSITVDFPEGGMVGHVAAPLFWGSGRGSEGEKGIEG